MTFTLERKIGAGVIGALLLALGFQSYQASNAAELAKRERARGDSLEAAVDTTRVVDLRKIYGDSIRAVERRAIQSELARNAADAALGRVAAANATMAASIASLAARVGSTGGTTETAEGDRKAAFDVRQPPYTAHADVSLPEPPAPGTLDLTVQLDTARLSVRLQCGEPVRDFRPASVLVETPPWLRIRIDSVQQSPDICNPPNPRHPWWNWANIRQRLAVGPSVACGAGIRGADCVVGLGGTIDIMPRKR